MIKKIIFISDISNNSEVGASHKIRSQIKAFKKLGETKFISLNQEEISNQNIVLIKKNRFNELFFFLSALKILKKTKKTIIYIRNPNVGLTPFFFTIFLIIRKSYYNDVIILEVPTYPYFEEKKGISAKISYFSHVINRPFLKYFVDKIITFTSCENIWGVNTIRVPNGISLSNQFDKKSIIKNISQKKNEKIIKFLCLAHIANWHGIDRLINGFLSNKGTDCELHIISQTTKELLSLKNLIIKLNLQHKIFIHENISQEQIHNIASICQIGVDSLARHRVKNYANSSLKSKDYLYLGLPVVLSHIDEDLEHLPFVFKVPSNDDAIEINKIIEWFEINKFDHMNIHDLAIKNFEWYEILKNII